jgi:hypothetical protein
MLKLINFRWPQGEDLNIRLLYKEGSGTKAVPVPLNSGYSLRMDLVVPDTRTVAFSFLSDEHPNTLGSGRNNQPNINIFLPRSATLPGGELYSVQSTTFAYDVFLRNTLTDKQVKLIRGTITLESSNTLWT